MATEKYTNNASTTLNGAIDGSTTSVVVTSASTFPTSGNFRILIDSEIMKVTAVSSNTFTVIRGAEGTTATSHANGAACDCILTKGALDAIRSDDVDYDIWANRPSAAINGRIFLPSNSIQLSLDNGSSWASWTPGVLFNATLPPSSGWTWYDNTATSGSQFTVTAINAGLDFEAPVGNNTTNNRAIYYRPYPTSNFTLTMGILPNWSERPDQTDVIRFGIGILGNSNTVITFDLNVWSGANRVRAQELAWASHVQGGSATNIQVDYIQACVGPFWLSLQDDGTNRTWSWSNNGLVYNKFYKESRTANLTGGPQNIGFFIGTDKETTGYAYGATLFHWSGVS